MITRRGFVQWIGAGAAVAALPACGDNRAPDATPPRGDFFDAHGWATIDAAAEALLPGASAALVVRYIDRLLTAFDHVPPRIFGGGPFSDRGGARVNAFADALPLTRAQDLAWRIRIFGSAATPGGDFNAATLGPTIGYRELYTRGIAALDAADFLALAPDARASLLAGMTSDPFYVQLLHHTCEGMFAAPEYGGNADLAGWRLARYDGDSAPRGHAHYDAQADALVDDPARPTTIASDPPEDFDAAALDLLTFVATGSGGKRYF